MDPTREIRNVKTETKAEYVAMMKAILEVPNCQEDRSAVLAIFEPMRKALSTESNKHFTNAIMERERIHAEFMNDIYPLLFKHHYGADLLVKDQHQHDHTKDDLFAFIMASQFDILKVTTSDEEISIKSRIGDMVKSELKRHYTEEPHHPEHEALTGNECTVYNIFEMAIDRLCRNVQFNNGNIDIEKMDKFRPTFTLGDTKAKDKVYWSIVLTYKDQVSQKAIKKYFQ